MTQPPLRSRLLAEAAGTFVVVFFGCGALVLADRVPGSVEPATVPIVFGLAVATMIYAVGHISGAHFNPAVTLAFAVGRHFPRVEVPSYWAAQIGGALAASTLHAVLFPSGAAFGATVLSIPSWPAFGWEIVLTAVLMFVITAVATDTRAVGVMAGVAIGSAVALSAFVGGPMTGASMNPARSLAPALFQGAWTDFHVYVLGPAIGAVVGALAYGLIRGKGS